MVVAVALRLIGAERRPFYAKATGGVWDTSTVPSWVTVNRKGQTLEMSVPFVCMAMQGQTFWAYVGSDNYRAETLRQFPRGALYGPGSNEVLVIPV